MTNDNIKIKNFTDLNAWKKGHEFVLYIYKISRDFPKEEQYGLTSQIRRAAVSITSNLAEGFSRYSYKEKSQFYSIALGSLTEVQNQLLIARDLKYLKDLELYLKNSEHSILLNKLINGLIKSVNGKPHAT